MATAASSAHEWVRRFMRGAFVTIFCALASASFMAHAWDSRLSVGNSVTGSGIIKSETRNVTGFTGIALAVSGLVEIRQGSTESVTVETDDNVLPLIETVVDNGTLKIRLAKRNISVTTKKMKFIVYAKTINSLEIAGAGDMKAEALKVAGLKASVGGSGDISIKSLEAGALSVSIAGSGKFSAGGRAASLDASIAGSGDIEAGNLDTRTAEISIEGSGDATLRVRESLKASIAGSGDIRYYGDPRLQKSIAGSGSVKPANGDN